MTYLRTVLLFFVPCLISCVTVKDAVRSADEVPVEDGISRVLAVYRKSIIGDINYRLELDIPESRSAKIQARALLDFELKKRITGFLQLDFKEDPKKISVLHVNGKPAIVQHQHEHLMISAEDLQLGKNIIELFFEAGESALNRNEDYLYTLFVPDRARTVFPCFDQPDLKATYTLTLKIPGSWKAIANAAVGEILDMGSTKVIHYKTSDTLSTYLFAFAAGNFQLAAADLLKQNTEFLYRETDTAKIAQSVKTIFDTHAASLQFLEGWTAIPYPFQKFGFVAIPDFQFGGMEHPGAIQYKSSALFLDAGAIKDQLNARSNVIAHETAHMWFGDLVTMNWFTDVWMKEVFANFMADKSTEASIGKDDFDLKFLVDHFPAAYAVDRTGGANPIRQDLDNLKDAGSLYGNIIYHKAPVMMRQLERLMGKEKFQQGVRTYLKKFSNGNASWPDLIDILSRYAGHTDLRKWNKVWVNSAGRPVFDYRMDTVAGKIRKFMIFQHPEFGEKRTWRQIFEMTFFYAGYSKIVTVNMDAEEMELKDVAGMDIPLFVLFNSSGEGYGLWPVDVAMPQYMAAMKSNLHRASAYISLYENMLSGRAVKPGELLVLLAEELKNEKEELNIKLITGYISGIFWEFISAHERFAQVARLEDELWQLMHDQQNAGVRKLLFKTYQDIFLTTSAGERLYQIWKDQKAPPGVVLTEDDYTALALSLALRDTHADDILKKQYSRISNPDRKIRFEFLRSAASPDVNIRDAFFKSLEQKVNREKEANVVSALYYLHHPLRQATSVRYLAKSLEMLMEIQRTGDIFFPQNWLQASFGNYQSSVAADIIRAFLLNNPDYNPKLKAKILQAADNVFKAEQLLKNSSGF